MGANLAFTKTGAELINSCYLKVIFIYVNNSQYYLYLKVNIITAKNKNSSRCSIVGINGKIDPLSESDEVDEEVIYSQESPNMEEFYRDFDWELDRFVEYRLPIKKPL